MPGVEDPNHESKESKEPAELSPERLRELEDMVGLALSGLRHKELEFLLLVVVHKGTSEEGTQLIYRKFTSDGMTYHAEMGLLRWGDIKVQEEMLEGHL